MPLAGITTVKQVRESSFDIRATSRLNRLYVELLRDNPDWGTAARRPDMHHFMARLIFCFRQFKPLFELAQAELGHGLRQTRRLERKSEIAPGRLYIFGGQKAYVAAMAEPFTNGQARPMLASR